MCHCDMPAQPAFHRTQSRSETKRILQTGGIAQIHRFLHSTHVSPLDVFDGIRRGRCAI